MTICTPHTRRRSQLRVKTRKAKQRPDKARSESKIWTRAAGERIGHKWLPGPVVGYQRTSRRARRTERRPEDRSPGQRADGRPRWREDYRGPAAQQCRGKVTL